MDKYSIIEIAFSKWGHFLDFDREYTSQQFADVILENDHSNGAIEVALLVLKISVLVKKNTNGFSLYYF